MMPVMLAAIKLPSTVFAVTCTSKNLFFFIPPWYEYIQKSFDANCNVTTNFKFPNDLWLIGLAIVDILLRIAGFVAVVSVIAAGVMLITSNGNPENTAKARKRIVSSLIGLIIVFVAATVVSFIGNSLGG